MDGKILKQVSKAAAVAVVLAVPCSAYAVRTETSMDSGSAVHGLVARAAGAGRSSSGAAAVQNNSSPKAVSETAGDARLADYLEWHGRVVDGSIRSTLMPWSALQQIAN